MRVSKQEAEKNRKSLLRAASRLFRAKGIEGVGVAEVAKAAGLTHGALYAHFPSKEALAAEAFSSAFTSNMLSLRKWESDRKRTFEDYLDAMFSVEHRDNIATGCPMTASASEIARQGCAVAASFARAFKQMVAILEKSLPTDMPASQKRKIALSALASHIGAIAVSRAVAKVDPSLSKEVLRLVRDTVRSACPAKGSRTKKLSSSPRKK